MMGPQNSSEQIGGGGYTYIYIYIPLPPPLAIAPELHILQSYNFRNKNLIL
jgi:hypothetical protein